MAKQSKSSREEICVPALQTMQGPTAVYAFFLPGRQVTQVADISRIARDQRGKLHGFQRPEIKEHVRNIAEYLKNGDVLFPNAIILALSSDVRFESSRGTRKRDSEGAQPGYLFLEARETGDRLAWIVDGQQRSTALADCDSALPIPVVAFVSDKINTYREQFILVNKARPLPNRLIEELLPATQSVLLPRQLNAKRIPSKLCDLMNQDEQSPFFGLIRRASTEKTEKGAVVIDTAVTKMIRARVDNPLGALAIHRGITGERAQVQAMYNDLCEFWSAVRTVFPSAWGLPAEKSRLMHSAGIQAMGAVMDRIAARHAKTNGTRARFIADLAAIAPYCRWTEGTWEGSGRPWNRIENTSSDIRLLQSTLIQIYADQVS
ncbi:MAG TPA: DGQHR domain-containing protein DpdB [Usitatibacter sp.]|nr:DGQHR domain-containing protein DpdB [Usitatibacter sp.]